jgi:hypothetical protein
MKTQPMAYRVLGDQFENVTILKGEAEYWAKLYEGTITPLYAVEPHFNELSPAQAERLALLIEEQGKVLQVIGKILRFGYDSRHPKNPRISNRELLEKELDDVDAALALMFKARDISENERDGWARNKLSVIARWVRHQ